MKKTILIGFLAFGLVFASVLQISACWASPEAFLVHSEDGQRVFRFEPASWEELEPEEIATAKISLHDSAGKVIWQAEDFQYLAFEGSFVFTEDLSCFAFFFPDTYTYALAFYANGELLRQYRVDELLKNINKMPETSIGYSWRGPEEHVLNPENNTLTVTTVEKRDFVFDMTTGELLSGSIENPILAAAEEIATFIEVATPDTQWWMWGALIGGLGLLAVIVFIVILRKQRPRRGKDAVK